METTANVSAKIRKWESAATIINLRVCLAGCGEGLWTVIGHCFLLPLSSSSASSSPMLPPPRLSTRRRKHVAPPGHFLATRQSVSRTKVRTAPPTHPTQLLALSTLDAASSHLRCAIIGGRWRVGTVNRTEAAVLQVPASLFYSEQWGMLFTPHGEDGCCFFSSSSSGADKPCCRTSARGCVSVFRVAALHFRDERSTSAVTFLFCEGSETTESPV